MELRHLRYFIAVALEENVSKAALKLRVSQPALSRQIRDLEDELGFDLLERSAKSVRLTEAGHTFLDEASEVLERLEEGIEKAKSIASKDEPELWVGYAPSLTPRLLPGILREFKKTQPEVKVKLRDLSTEEMRLQLREGKLNFALGTPPPKTKLQGLKYQELLQERIMLATSPNHNYANWKAVPITELTKGELVIFEKDSYPDYFDMISRVFEPAGPSPRKAEEVDSVASLISAVEAGNKTAIVTESIICMAGPRLSLLPIEPEPQPLSIGILWSEEKLDSVSTQFLDTAKGLTYN